jgi:ABC-type amino acid transport substrate-binding protein
MTVGRYFWWCVALACSACSSAGAQNEPAQAAAARAQTHRSATTPTLDGVRRKGFVQCGLTTGVAGFSAPDAEGRWRGLDVDVCRAIAAAVLGDATKVRFTPLTASQRFTVLQTGEIDVLSRITTITFQRDVQPRKHEGSRRARRPFDGIDASLRRSS